MEEMGLIMQPHALLDVYVLYALCVVFLLMEGVGFAYSFWLM